MSLVNSCLHKEFIPWAYFPFFSFRFLFCSKYTAKLFFCSRILNVSTVAHFRWLYLRSTRTYVVVLFVKRSSDKKSPPLPAENWFSRYLAWCTFRYSIWYVLKRLDIRYGNNWSWCLSTLDRSTCIFEIINRLFLLKNDIPSLEFHLFRLFNWGWMTRIVVHYVSNGCNKLFLWHIRLVSRQTSI